MRIWGNHRITTFQIIALGFVLVLLITIGGIGFLVWNDVKQYGFRLKQYRLQSKIALAASGIMILIPFFWFLFSVTNQAPMGERVLPSLFQSVTLRTAGFNTMDLNGVSGGGQLKADTDKKPFRGSAGRFHPAGADGIMPVSDHGTEMFVWRLTKRRHTWKASAWRTGSS